MKIHPIFLLAFVVLAILVFMAMVFPKKQFNSKTSIAKIQISEFEQVLEAFKHDNKRYPTTAEGLDVLVTDPGNLKNWNGPYLKTNVPNVLKFFQIKFQLCFVSCHPLD